MTTKPILWKCMECNGVFSTYSERITDNHCPYKDCQEYKDSIKQKLMQERKKIKLH
ncbi:hypothetical protein [Spiroplasma endosymbiont of Amphimallon solstitiale]|uniref:hypothetical protein n=1 Tax=Spiroplasma endosymbiont of Amphimallon solstitiale TaxID=3066288 RepID=UPI00313B7F3D